MATIRAALAIPALVAVASVAACGDAPKAPPQTAVEAPKTLPRPPANRLPKEAPTSPTSSAVLISPEIARACGIKEPDAYFAFDSDHLRADDVPALGQVATCFMSGPLKGRTLRIVGHTDPRGGPDYNMTLGQSRADAVTSYIASKGLDKGKAQSSTRGEMDAAGTDEPSWAKDRRVDLLVGK